MGKAAPRKENLEISPPNIRLLSVKLIGTTPLVTHKMSEKARKQMQADQEAGSSAKLKKRKRPPRDFEEEYEQAKHLSREGWVGMSAGAFRNAMISACRLVGFTMTHARLSIFIEAEGYDAIDGTPLVQIHGTPRMVIHPVRLASGVLSLAARPMWDDWHINLTVEYDADQFTENDVTNLLLRVGRQVAIGEGRYDSKKSNGVGWGCFRLAASAEEAA